VRGNCRSYGPPALASLDSVSGRRPRTRCSILVSPPVPAPRGGRWRVRGPEVRAARRPSRVVSRGASPDETLDAAAGRGEDVRCAADVHDTHYLSSSAAACIELH
jgi:hypothetical protein